MEFNIDNLKEIPTKVGKSFKKNPLIIGVLGVGVLGILLLKNKSSGTTESEDPKVPSNYDGYPTTPSNSDTTTDIVGDLSELMQDSQLAYQDQLDQAIDKIQNQTETNNDLIQSQIDSVNDKIDSINSSNSSLLTGVTPSTITGSYVDNYGSKNFKVSDSFQKASTEKFQEIFGEIAKERLSKLESINELQKNYAISKKDMEKELEVPRELKLITENRKTYASPLEVKKPDTSKKKDAITKPVESKKTTTDKKKETKTETKKGLEVVEKKGIISNNTSKNNETLTKTQINNIRNNAFSNFKAKSK